MRRQRVPTYRLGLPEAAYYREALAHRRRRIEWKTDDAAEFSVRLGAGHGEDLPTVSRYGDELPNRFDAALPELGDRSRADAPDITERNVRAGEGAQGTSL